MSPAATLRPDDPPPVELLLVGGRSGADGRTAVQVAADVVGAAGWA